MRLPSLMLTAMFLIGTTLAVRAAGQPAPANSPLTINAAADAYVNQNSPASNYGTSTALRVDASPINRSYLRFVVSGLNGTVQSVQLQVYVNSSNPIGIIVQAEANNTWSESQITYSNAPGVGSKINASSGFGSGVWVSVDVSSYIKGNGTYSFVLTTTSSTNINLSSREVSGKAPRLVISSGTSVTPTKTSLPSSAPTKTAVPSGTPTKTPMPTATLAKTATPNPGSQPSFPIRAAFYYPWFPEAWTQKGIYPYTNYNPKLGFYTNVDQNIIKQHIAMMQYGNIQAAIASWWGQGSQTDSKIAGLLQAAAGTNFRWALYYENESTGDPSASQIQNDLTYIKNHYGGDPSYLKVGGKFVVFVYADGSDACGMADRWKQGNTVGAYVALKVFPGYGSCASQPDSWHQYSPAVAADQQGGLSYSISPGFWLKGNAMRLARDLTRWKQNIQDMVASNANWQLITTFSEWGEGTAVEPAVEWTSSSGFGQYLDALHTNGK